MFWFILSLLAYFFIFRSATYLQMRFSKTVNCYSFIKREAAVFLGVDKETEEREKARWLERRKRLCTRKYGLKPEHCQQRTPRDLVCIFFQKYTNYDVNRNWKIVNLMIEGFALDLSPFFSITVRLRANFQPKVIATSYLFVQLKLNYCDNWLHWKMKFLRNLIATWVCYFA